MSYPRRWYLPILVFLPVACTQTPHPLVGAQAPAVELQLLGGGSFDLAKHVNKDVVILDFWATWCGPCRESMPEIIGVANDYADKGVVLYAVNLGDSPDAVRAFLESIGVQCNVALDPTGVAAISYAASAIPQTVIADKTGRIQAVHVGYGPGMPKQLRRDLNTLIAGKSIITE